MAEPGRVDAILDDGTPVTVPEKKLPELQQSGGRELRPFEGERARKQIAKTPGAEVQADPIDTWLAAQHGWIRGVGEAAGVPVDEAAARVGDIFGKGATVREALAGSEERNPVTTGLFGLEGNVAGALGVAEALGAPGRVSAGVTPRTAAGVAGRMVYGGVENVVQSTTRDINEAALGKADPNGEKIYAQAPKHFLVGAAATGLFEGLAAGVERAGAKLLPSAAEAADRGASRAIGREAGLSGEEAVAAGERVRRAAPSSIGREIPRNSSELETVLTSEQSAARRAQQEAYAGAVDTAAARHASEEANLSLRQEGLRKGVAARGQEGISAAAERGAAGVRAAEDARAGAVLDTMAKGGAAVEQAELAAGARRAAAPEELYHEVAAAGRTVDEVRAHYDGLREMLVKERAQTAEAAVQLGAERAANAKELEDAVRAAERQGLTMQHGDDALGGYDPDFILGVMGHKKDDAATRWALEQMLLEQNLHVPTASQSTQLHLERLQAMAADLKTAHEEALAHIDRLDAAHRTLEREAEREIRRVGLAADQRIAGFQKAQAKEIAGAEKGVERTRVAGQREVEGAIREGDRSVSRAEAEAARGTAKAEKEAAASRGAFERGAEKERAQLRRGQDRELRGIKKPTGKTDMDPLIEHVRSKETGPAVSPGAALAAGISLAHGNVPGAAAALASSLVAGRVRAQGNLFAARALRGLAGVLRGVDEGIRKGAAQVAGRALATATASATDRLTKASKKSEPKFEDVVQQVIAARTNPALIDKHIKATLGDLSQVAPGHYTAVLAAAHRAQHFLESVLPMPQHDSHYGNGEPDYTAVSPTERYDFMQYVRALSDPREVYKDAMTGDVTEEQVRALEAVVPTLYKQMQAEIDYQVHQVPGTPVPYERKVHMGTLLGVVTDDVLEPDFQSALKTSYANKAAAGAPVGSKAPSEDRAVTKNMQSTSERVERGEP